MGELDVTAAVSVTVSANERDQLRRGLTKRKSKHIQFIVRFSIGVRRNGVKPPSALDEAFAAWRLLPERPEGLFMELKTRPRLAHGSYLSALWAGIVGAFILTIGGVIGRSLGLVEMNPEMGLGSMITSTVGPGVWLFGFFWHLVNGAIFGLVYAVAFRTFGNSGLKPGLLAGAVHYVAAGVFLGVVPVLHPFIPEQAPAPGWFALNTNFWTFSAVLLAHLVFGSIVGGLYYRSARKRATPLPVHDEVRVAA